MRALIALLLIGSTCGLIISSLVILPGCGSGSWGVRPTPVVGDEPAIRITNVTWYENLLGNIYQIKARGMVYNVPPGDYKVSAWIRVDGGWWPKPTFAHPYTHIGSNGRWATGNMVTGGNDEDADAVKVYLVKRSSTWRPGRDAAPAGDIVAEDMVENPGKACTAANGVVHQIVRPDRPAESG